MDAATVDFSELSLADTLAVFRRNAALRTVNECELILAAINVLRLDRPTESEHQGERISVAELNRTEDRATKRLAVLRMASRPTEVIVPPDVIA